MVREPRRWRAVGGLVVFAGFVVWGMLTVTAAGAIEWFVSDLIG